MLLKDFIRQGTEVLKSIYSERESGRIISILCGHFLGVKSYTHIVDPGYEIEKSRISLLNDALLRLRSGEPVQYITGEAPFGEFVFKVNKSVLIPRPETEMLVRETIGAVQPKQRILDLCTGSGCIAWSIALSIPGVEVVAVDISEAALELASTQPFSTLQNKRKAIAPKFIKFDVLDGGEGFAEGMFDVIVSNPPYIMASQKSDIKVNVLDYEPSIALFAPEEDPLAFYRSISVWAEKFLKPGGIALVEINDALASQTAGVFKEAGFEDISILLDLYDKERFIRFQK